MRLLPLALIIVPVLAAAQPDREFELTIDADVLVGIPDAAAIEVALDLTGRTPMSALGLSEATLANRDVALYSDGRLTPLTSGNAAGLVSASALVLERTGDAVTREVDPAGGERFILPFRFSRLVNDEGDIERLDYTPELRATTTLRFHGDRGRYYTVVRAGLFAPNPFGEEALEEELAVSLSSTTLDSIEPVELRFTALNAWRDVEVTASNVDNTPSLSVRPNFSSDSFELPLPVGPRPSATISFEDAAIPGFGLRVARATIRVLNIENPDGVRLSFRTDGGQFTDGGEVVLDADGRAELGLRSVGLGSATITSSDPLLAAVTADTIEFRLPWLFAIATLLGGLAGTVATRRSREHFAGAAVTGVVTGAIVVVAWAVGINLLGVEPTAQVGEAVVFVLSALGAVTGPAILKARPA